MNDPRAASIIFVVAFAVGIGVGLIVWKNLGMGIAIGAILGLATTFFEPGQGRNSMANTRPSAANPKRKINFMYIGLIIGVLIGAIFAHVEYDAWYIGALVGSGLGPIIGLVLQSRFPQ